MEKNEHITLDILDVSSEGTGIGKVDGFVVYVPDALPPERVRVVIIKVTAQYAVGKVLKRIGDDSPWRVEAPCPHAAQCGGCQIMHMRYEKQLEFKTKMVAQCMARIGGFSGLDVPSALGMEHPFYYRNKGVFPVGAAKGPGGFAMGMYAARSHRIIPVNVCRLQDERIHSVMLAVQRWMRNHGISAYDESNHTGLVRHVMGRVGYGTGQVMAVLVTREEALPHRRELLDALRREVRGLGTVVQNIQPLPTNVILGKKNITLWGEGAIEDCIGKVRFTITPHSFFQVNPQQTRVLYDVVKDFAALTGVERVYDAYCGVGTIGQYLADGAAEIYGVEEVESAVNCARENARRNGIPHAHYAGGRAEEEFPKWLEQGIHPDVIIVDPPRKGCHPSFLQAAAACLPSKIVYVSCNPATLARDAAILAKEGYRIDRIQPVDMFPQTTGVETVALFSSPCSIG